MTQETAPQSDAERAWGQYHNQYFASHAYPDMIHSECFLTGYDRGYAAGASDQAGRYELLWTAVADALGHWQADGRTVGLVTRIRTALADTVETAALAPKEPEA